ncbi:hypothetical protein [Roseibium album]|uniref:hypothetical protein n=1 Tax=Roseibium album TaxID=311410 RepID=UPI00391C1FCB
MADQMVIRGDEAGVTKTENLGATMSRHALEMKTVKSLKNLLQMPRKRRALSMAALEARYGREMEKLGYCDLQQIYVAWHDVVDIAELELGAQ